MAGGWEDYFWPGTDVLANKPGIRDPSELDAFERTATYRRIIELEGTRIAGAYDLEHLRAFHGHIFQDVYDWAGELRTVNMSKGGSPFARVEHLQPAAADVFAGLAREGRLQGLDRREFVARAAHYLGEVNALHPFREGNGRTQRAFFSQLAADDGRHFAWDKIDAARNTAASIDAHRGDTRSMESLLNDALKVRGTDVTSEVARRAQSFRERQQRQPPGRGPGLDR